MTALLAHLRRVHVAEQVLRSGTGSVRLRVRPGILRAVGCESDCRFMVQCRSETQRSVRSVFHSRCAGVAAPWVSSSAMGGAGSHHPVRPWKGLSGWQPSCGSITSSPTASACTEQSTQALAAKPERDSAR